MRQASGIAVIAFAAVALGAAGPAAARSHESAQAKSCRAEATKQGLSGAKRNAFVATCTKGSLDPKAPIGAASASAAAVTAPSGADTTDRSRQCNAEAARRKLQDSAFQAFRKGCLASAAPVRAIESPNTATKPTGAKPKLESMTNTPPK